MGSDGALGETACPRWCVMRGEGMRWSESRARVELTGDRKEGPRPRRASGNEVEERG